MLRTIVIVLALALMASGQNEIGRSEAYNGRIATNCALLPSGHPQPKLMRVSPNGQLLGYIGVGLQGEQALYFRSSACSTEPWRLFATASAFAVPGTADSPSSFSELLLTDTAGYVITPSPDGVLRSVWKIDLAANSKVLLAAERQSVGGIRPSLVISFTVTRTGEEILVARVGNNRIFRLSQGQWQEMSVLSGRIITGAFAHPAGLLVAVPGANFQSDVLLWNESTTTTVVDSRKQVLGEDLLSCCQVLNSQGLSLIQYNAINFYPDGGPKLATRVAEVLGDGGLRIVLADDGQRQPSSVWGVFPESSSNVQGLVANHFFSHRKSTGFASSLHLWDDIVGRQTVVVDDRGLLFGARVSALVVTPAGPDPRVVGGIWNNTASISNDGTVFVALRRIDVLNGGLFNGRQFDSVVRLTVPPPPPPPTPTATLTVDNPAIQTGQSTVLRWITANATAVSINQGIGSVSASGNRTVAPASTTTYTLTATGLGGTATARVTVTVNPLPPTISSVVNAADGNGLSPGVLATVFGKDFGSDAEVLVEYQPAPVLFRSGTQVNFQIPWEMGIGLVKVQVRRGGVTSPETTVNLTEASPAAFRHRGFAIVTDGDWRLVGNDEEALNPGRAYTLWLTGCGPTIPAIATGQPSPADPLATTYLPVRLAFNGQKAEVLWSGMAPGLVGVCQINFLFPGTPRGGNPERVLGEISIGSSSSRFEVFSN